MFCQSCDGPDIRNYLLKMNISCWIVYNELKMIDNVCCYDLIRAELLAETGVVTEE